MVTIVDNTVLYTLNLLREWNLNVLTTHTQKSPPQPKRNKLICEAMDVMVGILS